MKNPLPRMVIAGGSGFLGQSLADWFHGRYDVVVLSRHATGGPHARGVSWDGQTAGDWASEIEGADVLMNMTGKSVNCRKTPENMKRMIESRVLSTDVLGRVIAECESPPRVWINASTATLYEHSLSVQHGESGPTGPTPGIHDEFSIEIGRQWEGAFHRASCAGVRQVIQRTSMVLGRAPDTVFDVMCGLVRKGLGGRQGSGKQFVSWVHIEDYCRLTEWMIDSADAEGVYNVCAPEPIRNADQMKIYREALGVPIGLPASGWILELGAVFMRTETELILKSRNVIPARLLSEGFEFVYPDMKTAVANLLAASS